MMKQYQVTLVNAEGKYKPVSAIVSIDIAEYKKLGSKEYTKKIKAMGITKICQKRLWQASDLKKFSYNIQKIREYNREKIEKENAERYEKIKEEKYASGEWKKPKNKG